MQGSRLQPNAVWSLHMIIRAPGRLLKPVMLPCAGLLQADVPCSSHRLVALILMESYVRYYRCT